MSISFTLDDTGIRRGLDAAAEVDKDIDAVLQSVGYPTERRSDGGFPEFLRIIVGQQLSVKAARTIFSRLAAALNEMTPDGVMALSDAELRENGLSRQKIGYVRSLAEATSSGVFQPERLSSMDDDAAIGHIVQIKGLGRWSAQMYLMFHLGRPDIWPVDDLAVQEGVARLKRLSERPKPKEMEALSLPWQPHRSSVALLMWHYYANSEAPL